MLTDPCVTHHGSLRIVRHRCRTLTRRKPRSAVKKCRRSKVPILVRIALQTYAGTLCSALPVLIALITLGHLDTWITFEFRQGICGRRKEGGGGTLHSPRPPLDARIFRSDFGAQARSSQPLTDAGIARREKRKEERKQNKKKNRNRRSESQSSAFNELRAKLLLDVFCARRPKPPPASPIKRD